MPVTFVYFDLGQVLMHFDHRRAAEQLAALLDVSVEESWQALFESGLEDTFERGELTPQDFAQTLAKSLEREASTDSILKATSDIFWPNRPMLELLQELRAGPQRLGLLSNTCQAHWDWIRDTDPGLPDAFETLVLSFELGRMKPDPLIYQVAQEKAGVVAAEILFIDDRPENVAGAEAQGIQGLLYQSPAQVRRALEQKGIWINL